MADRRRAWFPMTRPTSDARADVDAGRRTLPPRAAKRPKGRGKARSPKPPPPSADAGR
jgi:hypothetical protein